MGMGRFPQGRSPRDVALQVTAVVAERILHGREPSEQIRVATTFPPAFARSERIWVHGPYRLQQFGALGDGTYEHRTTLVGGFGALGLTALAVSAGASAAGNRRRRQAAAYAATPQWHDIDQGTLYVGTHGMYFQSMSGIHPWAWSAITDADLSSQGGLWFSAYTQQGPGSWILLSDWAELAFVTWAVNRHPQHPRIVDGSWFPGGWVDARPSGELHDPTRWPQLPG